MADRDRDSSSSPPTSSHWRRKSSSGSAIRERSPIEEVEKRRLQLEWERLSNEERQEEVETTKIGYEKAMSWSKGGCGASGDCNWQKDLDAPKKLQNMFYVKCSRCAKVNPIPTTNLMSKFALLIIELGLFEVY